MNKMVSGRVEVHIFVLTSIIRNRKACGLSTFATFIDLRKAFDSVDRNALLYKLIINGIDGKMYKSIRTMYTDTIASVKLNALHTNWF